MATATRRGKVNQPSAAELIVKYQDEPDPDTGQFRSAEVIRRILEEEHKIAMTREGVRIAAKRYRSKHALPPPPSNDERNLPWTVSEEARKDATGYAVCRIGTRERARREGREHQFHDSELRAVAAFEKLLDRMDPAVVAFDVEANAGRGGWVIRPRVDGEEVWPGRLAVRPYPKS